MHPAAELEGKQLHPVTDAEDRDAAVEETAVRDRGVPGIDVRGRPGKNDALGLVLENLLKRHVIRIDLGEDLRLAHPARDQLGVLRPEIKNDDGLIHIPLILSFPHAFSGNPDEKITLPDPRLKPPGMKFALTTCVPQVVCSFHLHIPSFWAVWKSFPSVLIAGAITISVSCISRIFFAPTFPIEVRRAPTRFCVPSSRCAGP